MDDIKVIKSDNPGPTSVVLGGVHGDETCGVVAVEEAMTALAINKGTVILALGNPRAIAQCVRYTEENLNRMFVDPKALSSKQKSSYEYQRASVLKEYLLQADALLDVHASFTPESRPFVICEPNAADIVKYLPVPLVVSGFDEYEPGGTDYFMNKNERVGICVECGYLGDHSSLALARESITAFLQVRGHINGANSTVTQQHKRIEYKYYAKTDTFRLAKPFRDFEEVTSGEVIGIDGEKEVRAIDDGFVLFARNCSRRGEEAFLFGKNTGGLT
jgi:succinylglutamate desuccinylase